MKPAVDATSPRRYKHLTENLKGKQMAEDKRLETERINKASQARLASMASMSVRKQEVRSPPAPPVCMVHSPGPGVWQGFIIW